MVIPITRHCELCGRRLYPMSSNTTYLLVSAWCSFCKTFHVDGNGSFVGYYACDCEEARQMDAERDQCNLFPAEAARIYWGHWRGIHATPEAHS